MTENEAIEVLKDFDKQVTAKSDGAYQSTIGEMACKVAISALEEIQQYRMLEKRLNGVSLKMLAEHFIELASEGEIKGYERGRLLTNEDADRWDQFQALGTVEELQEAMEKQKPKKPTSRKKQPKIYYPNDEQLNQAFLDFIEMRNKIKKPMTDRAVKMAMNKLQRLAGTDNDLAIKILEQSVLHCWQDLYELKDDRVNHKSSGGIDWDNV